MSKYEKRKRSRSHHKGGYHSPERKQQRREVYQAKIAAKVTAILLPTPWYQTMIFPTTYPGTFMRKK